MINLISSMVIKLHPLIDTSLTTSNASKRGYKYMGDVLYDPLHPDRDLIVVLSAGEGSGCTLGRAQEDVNAENWFGVYVPLKSVK